MAKSSSPRRTKRTRSAAPARPGSRPAPSLFSRQNYLLLLLGLFLITAGYVAMRIENQVEGLISLYIAPLVILGGYLEIIYAILWRPREQAPVEST
jgi:hypothetical protein